MTSDCPAGMRRPGAQRGVAKCPGYAPEQGVRMAEHGGVCRSMHEQERGLRGLANGS